MAKRRGAPSATLALLPSRLQVQVGALEIVTKMASHPNYIKKQIAVDTVSWTAVVAHDQGNVQFDVASQRFRAGDTICFLQAASGTGPALATFVR